MRSALVVQIMEDVVRKVEWHNATVAVWSRDPNLECGGVILV